MTWLISERLQYDKFLNQSINDHSHKASHPLLSYCVVIMMPLNKLRKSAKGETCPARAAADIKGKTNEMTIGGTLGYLDLAQPACVAVNPKRIEHALQLWTQLPMELNRLALSASVARHWRAQILAQNLRSCGDHRCQY